MSSLRVGLVLAPVVTFALALLTVAAAACSTGDPAGADGEAPAAARPVEAVPTFAGTIETILQEKCQRCHSESGIAPFPLVSYEDIKGVALLARAKVIAKEMPPWGAFDDDACKVQHAFKDDLRLTADELAKLVGWIDNGMPRGDDALRPAAKHYPPVVLEGKTNTLTMAAPYPVPAAGGKDDIQCFPIDPGYVTDTWIGGTNVVPGAPSVVHHVIVYVDPKGESVAKAGANSSYPCFGGPDVSNPSLLLAWAPGVPPTDYGENVGLKIPKGARLVLQVHYHPTTQSVADQTKFELKVLEGKPDYVAQVILLGNAKNDQGPIKLLPGPDDPASGPAFVIPANAAKHTESMEVTLPDTIQGFPLPTLKLAAVGTHMHWAGVDMKVEIERKNPTDGQPAKECLVGTPKYDFNWQRGYAYAEPTEKLPTAGAGDKLRFTCTYDNTMNNNHVRKALAEQHIAAPTEIHLGEQTLDEMCLGVLVAVRNANLLD
jgi:hypothetical protein